MNKNTALKITITTSLFLLLVTPVFAQDDSTSDELSKEEKIQQLREEKQERLRELQEERDAKRAEMEEKKREREEEREEKVAEVCENVLERVQTRMENFEENKANHEENYNNITTRLSDIADMLDEKGLDTTELRADMETMDAMVAEYVATYTEFIGQLETSLNYDCGNSEGAFKEALQGARDTLETARVMRREIRDFYKSDIRQDIEDLREQATNLKTDEEVGNE